MYYVYVLHLEKSDNFYIGSTTDLKRRLAEHNQGMVSYTRRKKWHIVYYEAYLNEKSARYRESLLKKHGRAKQMLISRIKKFL